MTGIDALLAAGLLLVATLSVCIVVLVIAEQRDMARHERELRELDRPPADADWSTADAWKHGEPAYWTPGKDTDGDEVSEPSPLDEGR